jgi:ADP-heptose:LPS heptosyltransferase
MSHQDWVEEWSHVHRLLCVRLDSLGDVVLYALTDPQQTPWHARYRVLFHDVPCRYCYESVCPLGHHRCLAGIEPDEVVGAVDDMLSVASWPVASCLPAGGPGGHGPREQRWAS